MAPQLLCFSIFLRDVDEIKKSPEDYITIKKSIINKYKNHNWYVMIRLILKHNRVTNSAKAVGFLLQEKIDLHSSGAFSDLNCVIYVGVALISLFIGL